MNDIHLVNDLRTRFNGGELLKYVFFWGHQPGRKGVTASCFSQWYDSPFTVEGQYYATAEHFMMAEKAALFKDLETRTKILAAANPGAAKALGRTVSGFDETIWHENRFTIAVRGNHAKFAQHQELGNFLRNTGRRILVEASPVDKIWGIGLTQDDARATNPNQWEGLNLLGFALMSVRANI